MANRGRRVGRPSSSMKGMGGRRVGPGAGPGRRVGPGVKMSKASPGIPKQILPAITQKTVGRTGPQAPGVVKPVSGTGLKSGSTLPKPVYGSSPKRTRSGGTRVR